MADGSITIDVLANTDKFDKQIAKLEHKIQKAEKKDLRVNAQIEENKEIGRAYEQVYKALTEEAEEYEKEIQKINAELSKIPVDNQGKPLQNAKRYNDLMRERELTQYGYDALNNALDITEAKTYKLVQDNQALKEKQQEIRYAVEEYRKEIESINFRRHQQDIDKVKRGFNTVGSNIQNIIKKVGMLALSVMAVRSAVSLLSRASSDLASYDKQYAANLEYIRFVLTQAVAPILRYIVGLAMQLLSYINAIAQAWFGVNLFANGSVEAFKKMKAGAGGVGKAVKEIKKQLLGFDEINMLTDQSDSGTSAGAGGVGIPSMDLSEMNKPLPKWLQDLIDEKDTILTIIGAMAGWKVGASVLTFLSKIGLVKDLPGALKILTGITLMITGITLVYGSVKKMLDGDLSPLNLLKGIAGAAITGVGAGLLFGGPVGWTIGLTLALIVTTVWALKKQEETNKHLANIMGVDYDNMGFKEKMDFWIDFNLQWFGFKEATEPMQKLKEEVSNTLDNMRKDIDNWFHTTPIIKDIVELNDKIGEKVNEEKEKIMETFRPITDFFKGIFDTIWNNLKVIIDNVKLVFNTVKDYIYNLFRPVVEFFGNIFNQVVNKIKSIFNPIIDYFRGIWDRVTSMFRDVAMTIGNAIGGVFKNAINTALSQVERILNNPIRTINGLVDYIRQFPGMGGLRRLNTFSLPRLAVGGIVNMPNRGTLVGGAIAGESGREGVIPLTDSQAMAQLGREIGRYITINANITNTMNGRTISRELKQIQNQQDFAYNM